MAALEHDPEKRGPVFGKDHNGLERDDDSKNSHRALAVVTVRKARGLDAEASQYHRR
jgi:hypothetical protein